MKQRLEPLLDVKNNEIWQILLVLGLLREMMPVFCRAAACGE
jgi:hypothetical protein